MMIGIAAFGLIEAASVRAQVAIANSSFESPALVARGFTTSVPPGWTLVAGETHLLAVQVVHRPGFFSSNYRIDLFAEDILLGSDLGSLIPPVGGKSTSLIQYTAGVVDPVIGEPLEVRHGGATWP